MFSEIRNLTLSTSFWQRRSTEVNVHNAKMKNISQEKYLGDLVNTTGNIKATVAVRVAKGYGIVSEIEAIINEVQLGKYKLEVGLQLMQAVLINGLLYWVTATIIVLRLLFVLTHPRTVQHAPCFVMHATVHHIFLRPACLRITHSSIQ
jgi:hypothetical protein